MARIVSRPDGKGIRATAGGAPLGFRLRKGEEKADGSNKPGADLDHFRVTFEDIPTIDPNLAMQAWNDLYGDKPSVIRGVMLYSADLDQVWSEANEQWGSAGGSAIVMRRCDGHTLYQRRIGDKTSFEPTPCLCANEQKPLCKQTARFTFWLPELCRAVDSLFVGMLVTHGAVDISNIRATIDQTAATFQNPRQVAFVLRRQPVKVTAPNGMSVTKSMVFLDFDTVAAQQAATLAIGASGTPALPASLPAPQGFTEVELTHYVVRLTDNGTEYRFKSVSGAVYTTTDTNVVMAVLPQIMGAEVGKAYSVPYSIWASVTGATITELLKGS